MRRKIFLKTILILLSLNVLHGQRVNYYAFQADIAPSIDGIADEPCWERGDWGYLDNEWFGLTLPDSSDFFGRYKAAWTHEKLFLLVEITDDHLIDDIGDPLDRYWEDDCLEIFIDEDDSGGDHKCCESAYNAFAYHTSPVTYDAVDLSSKGDFVPQLFNDHLEMAVSSTGSKHAIELAIDIYDESYREGGEDSTPVSLKTGKVLGFSLAYCDDDGNGRENFIGTQPGGLDSWMNADLFGRIELISDVSVITNQPDPGFKLFPVPAGEILYLKNSTSNSFSYGIYNTSGILMGQGSRDSFGKQESLDTSRLKEGLYYLMITQGGYISTLRFEIMR